MNEVARNLDWDELTFAVKGGHVVFSWPSAQGGDFQLVMSPDTARFIAGGILKMADLIAPLDAEHPDAASTPKEQEA